MSSILGAPIEAPRYGGPCLDGVLPSAAAALGVAEFDNVLRLSRADSMVVLLVDGLGWRQLEQHRELAPFLSSMEPAAAAGDGIDAAFPTTTPVSLATLGCGMAPGQHGIVGARFWLPETDAMLLPLSWGQDPRPEVVQPFHTVLDLCEHQGVATTQVGPRVHEGTGLTLAALNGGHYRGANTMGERIAEAAAAVRTRPALVFVYYGELDQAGHVHGVDSPHWRHELVQADRFAYQLAGSLPAGVALVVTADHGIVDCPDDERVELESSTLRERVQRIGGEPRMRHVYTENGAADEVCQRWQTTLGEAASVYTRRAAIDLGLFGPDVTEAASSRIGDVIAIARGSVRLGSRRVDPTVSDLRGQHGALSETERLVPLLQTVS